MLKKGGKFKSGAVGQFEKECVSLIFIIQIWDIF